MGKEPGRRLGRIEDPFGHHREIGNPYPLTTRKRGSRHRLKPSVSQTGNDRAAHGLTGFARAVWRNSGQDSWPLRLAAVEAGKWGCGRPGRRFHCDAYELVGQDGVGDHRQELSIVA